MYTMKYKLFQVSGRETFEGGRYKNLHTIVSVYESL